MIQIKQLELIVFLSARKATMVNNKKIVLIGHKQDQTEDIAFMIKNDPPTLD